MLRICEDCIHNKVCNEWAVTSGIPFVSANTCENFMTADVVPRSEVEELNRECESLGKTVNEASELIRKLKGKVEEAKAEVAREIFEEIYEDCFDQFGHIDYEALAELKKKYTEEHQ